MRCPKCGYFSFDHQENCRKCNRNILDTAHEINGTVYDSPAPLFLRIIADEPDYATAASQRFSGRGFEGSAQEEEQDDNLDVDDIAELDIDQGHGFGDDAAEEIVMNLDDLRATSPRDEFTLEFDEEKGKKEGEPALPSLDFGDIDISDLAPPVDDDKQFELAEEPAMAETVAVAASPAHTVQASEASKHSGLEDLQLNDLDLETPAKFVSGSAAGKRFSPAVKTGTALDKFEIDLGELFAEKK